MYNYFVPIYPKHMVKKNLVASKMGHVCQKINFIHQEKSNPPSLIPRLTSITDAYFLQLKKGLQEYRACAPDLCATRPMYK